ncbi:uncharacterized protein LOC110026420 [Phalaenopsis equestris]|uniref:uncharacterized protein LOC110026420 n=1 Tax=Phalaenopsis equestris TaxID=78828 RepID=UPI0009E46C77|nr:uncharacterized protein LOC110026420 [Phalaenopsis equestris]XP_020583007.1 uncharacterized protein LOC110026420 [Phalaenopsis equestris]
MEVPQAVHPFANSVSEDSGFELNLRRLGCEIPCAEDDEQCACTNVSENVVKKVQRASHCRPSIKRDRFINGEVDVDEIFPLQSSHEQLAQHNPASEVYNSEDISACKELIISDFRQSKCLIKSATFPSSEIESQTVFSPEKDGESSSTAAPGHNASADQLPVYKRSTSLPASSKLVSAMKGGRKQNGTSPRTNMRVKWAEDVYVPPATSVSHTVKSYTIQRTKSKKKDNHRQKHNKGKNSRGNGSGKKFPNRGNVGVISSSFSAKLQSGGANGLASKTEDILEFVGGGAHDAKCGSVFLRESLAKVHLSFGEAT